MSKSMDLREHWDACTKAAEAIDRWLDGADFDSTTTQPPIQDEDDSCPHCHVDWKRPARDHFADCPRYKPDPDCPKCGVYGMAPEIARDHECHPECHPEDHSWYLIGDVDVDGRRCMVCGAECHCCRHYVNTQPYCQGGGCATRCTVCDPEVA